VTRGQGIGFLAPDHWSYVEINWRGSSVVSRVSIPGRGILELEHLVLDLNGTIAVDGEVLAGVPQRLAALSKTLTVHLVTADTQGRAAVIAEKLRVKLVRVTPGDEAEQKRALVERLGAERVVAIGNGANDAGMLQAAALGIAVIGTEGLAVEALQAADMVATIHDALDLLLHPRRLVATLRE
jgi:P-type E1-E2 ATPase